MRVRVRFRVRVRVRTQGRVRVRVRTQGVSPPSALAPSRDGGRRGTGRGVASSNW